MLGSNGAGKTTLFNCVTGDFPPTSGTVGSFGEDVTDFPPHERIRRGLRRTYQISLLFGGLTRARQCLSRLPRRLARPLLAHPARRNDALMQSALDLVNAVHLTIQGHAGLRAQSTASSASLKSRWPCPARRASSCSTSPPPACRRPSAPS